LGGDAPGMSYEPPIEAERRRVDGRFQADIAIKLCDGVNWFFPRPRLAGRYMAPIAKDGSYRELGVTEFGPEYDFRVEEFIIDSIHENIRNESAYWLAAFLLKQNYVLTDREMYWLLQLKDDYDTNLMWTDILAVATGLIFMVPKDPKASTTGGMKSSGGSDSPSSPATSNPAA
jgi:hypothetical protein